MKKITRRSFITVCGAAAAAMALTACGGAASSTVASSAAESTSSSAAAETAAGTLSGNVATGGSTSMKNVIAALTEGFAEVEPGVTVSYDPTGSGAGITGATDKTLDIGLSSRALKDDEKADVEGTTIALDGIAIIVNNASKVEDLTVDQLKQMFTGEITNWSEVGGDDGEIVLIGREAGSGTRDGFESIVDVKDSCKYAQELTATGAVISAVLIPPIGILGSVVGLYMRTVTDPAVFTAKTALTRFILDYSGLPGAVSGILLGTLLITSVGTGAGLALGIAAIIRRDILGGRTKKLSQGFTEKLIIVAVLALAAIFSVVVPSETILQFSFMSMGLRGCTVFAPLCFVIWAKGKVAPKYAVLSITVGSGVALLLGLMNLFGVLSLPCDAVFPGVAVGLAFMFSGLLLGGNRRELHI